MIVRRGFQFGGCVLELRETIKLAEKIYAALPMYEGIACCECYSGLRWRIWRDDCNSSKLLGCRRHESFARELQCFAKPCACVSTSSARWDAFWIPELVKLTPRPFAIFGGTKEAFKNIFQRVSRAKALYIVLESIRIGGASEQPEIKLPNNT